MSTPGGGLRRSRSGHAPDDRPAETRPRGRGALGAVGLLGGGLAATAAVVVVLSDDARWLRLAAVAALWAALLAVVVLVRRAGEAPERSDDEADRMRQVYERELAHEVDARREFEESLEEDLRRELTAELEGRHSDEVAGLRAELERLQAREAVPSADDAVTSRYRTPVPVTEVRTPQQRMTALDSGPGVRAVHGPPVRVEPVGAGAPTGAVVPAPPARPAPGPASGPSPLGGSSDPGIPARPSPPTPSPPTPPRSTPPPPPAPTRGAAMRSFDPRPDRDRGRPERASSPRAPHPPDSRGAGLEQGSFVDQYIRAAGGAPGDAPDGADRAVPPRPDPPRPDPPREEPQAPATTGRTVAELLAAHAAERPRPARRSGS